MIDARHTRPRGHDPARCRHRRFRRVGIQRAPVPPFRLYLLTCMDCGTTLTTQTLRHRRESASRPSMPAPCLEEDLSIARRRRWAG